MRFFFRVRGFFFAVHKHGKNTLKSKVFFPVERFVAWKCLFCAWTARGFSTLNLRAPAILNDGSSDPDQAGARGTPGTFLTARAQGTGATFFLEVRNFFLVRTRQYCVCGLLLEERGGGGLAIYKIVLPLPQKNRCPHQKVSAHQKKSPPFGKSCVPSLPSVSLLQKSRNYFPR